MMNIIEAHELELYRKSTPSYLFWKDRKLAYQGGNDWFLKAIGLQSPNELVGRTDHDFPWAKEANRYRETDISILEGKAIVNQQEERWHVEGPKLILINKLPLKNEKNEIVGVIAMHRDITLPKSFNLYSDPTSAQADIAENELFALINNVVLDARLTHREIESLSLWLSGYSIKESAYCLNISQKSIEFYRKNVKEKMGVHHKFQLIDLMQAKGVFHLFLSLAKLIKNRKP